MTTYIGDFNPSDVFDFKFCTVNTSGAPTTLTTSPAVSVYKGNSVTQSTSGVTLTTDFDAVTGLNNVNVDTSTSASFYAAGSNFQCVITAGTVGGTTVSGYVVAQFSIQNRSPLRPTTAGRTANVGSDGNVASNVLEWNGAAISAPATAGIPDVNTKNINNVAASSVTTISANIGTTQPINFTGTAGSALVKSDMIDIAGAAVATGSAQIGVNVVNIGGAASHAQAGYVGTDHGNIANPTATVALTGTTIGTVSLTTTASNLTNAATNGDLTATMKASVTAAALTTQMTESYAALHTAPTLAQAVFEMRGQLCEKSVTGTTVSMNGIDGVTLKETFNLNDPTTPTAITRAS